jgi:hypothetical protein
VTDASLDRRLRVSDDVVFREMEGEAVLLNLDSGMYFGLDAIGTRIWQLLGEHQTLQAVFDQMLQEFEVDGPTLRSDLLALVDRLMEHGLVQAP